MGAPEKTYLMNCIKSDGITIPTDYEGHWSLLAISTGVSELMDYEINGNPVAEYFPNLISDGSAAFTYKMDNVPIISGNLEQIKPGEFFHEIYANNKTYKDEEEYNAAFNPDDNTIPNYCVYKKDDLVSIVTDRSQKYLWLSANKSKLIDILSTDSQFVDNLISDVSNELNLNLIKFDITKLFDQIEQIPIEAEEVEEQIQIEEEVEVEEVEVEEQEEEVEVEEEEELEVEKEEEEEEEVSSDEENEDIVEEEIITEELEADDEEPIEEQADEENNLTGATYYIHIWVDILGCV